MRVAIVHILLVHCQKEQLVLEILDKLKSQWPSALDTALIKETILGTCYSALSRHVGDLAFLRALPLSTMCPAHRDASLAGAVHASENYELHTFAEAAPLCISGNAKNINRCAGTLVSSYLLA